MRRRLALLTTALLAAMTLSPAAPAAASVDNAAITGSGCFNGGWLDWKGRLNPDFGPPEGAYGSQKFCWTRYKIDNTSANYDYYAIELDVTFNQNGYNLYHGGEGGYLRVVSDKNTQDEYFESTPTQVWEDTCTSFDVGVSRGPLSASAPFRLCDYGVVKRIASGSQGSSYTINNPSRVKRFTIIFFQKVNAGARPSFNVQYRWPAYQWKQPDAQHDKWWWQEEIGQWNTCFGPCND